MTRLAIFRLESFGTWPSPRRGAAALAVTTAFVTAAAILAFAGDESWSLGPALYLFVTVCALVFPAAIAVQVVGGQVLVWGLLSSSPDFAPLSALPVVVGIILTAELLAIVARLDTPLLPASAGSFADVGKAALIGGFAFAVVVLAGAMPGPGGLAAVIVASAACAGIANLLLAAHRKGRASPPR